jgi:hypothetical protein
MEILSTVQNAWQAFVTQITIFIPLLLGAIIIFVVGWFAAKISKRVISKVLSKLQLDKTSEKTGLKEFLQKGNVTQQPSEIVGLLTYWFIMLLTLVASLDTLGLPIASDILNEIFLYIPNVVAAVLVLILGIFLGNLLSSVVQTTVANAGFSNPESMGKISLYAVIFFSGTIALSQLGVGSEIVTAAFILAFGGFSLACGLAFGLGGKDVAAEYLQQWLQKEKKKD